MTTTGPVARLYVQCNDFWQVSATFYSVRWSHDDKAQGDFRHNACHAVSGDWSPFRDGAFKISHSLFTLLHTLVKIISTIFGTSGIWRRRVGSIVCPKADREECLVHNNLGVMKTFKKGNVRISRQRTKWTETDRHS